MDRCNAPLLSMHIHAAARSSVVPMHIHTNCPAVQTRSLYMRERRDTKRSGTEWLGRYATEIIKPVINLQPSDLFPRDSVPDALNAEKLYTRGYYVQKPNAIDCYTLHARSLECLRRIERINTTATLLARQ